MAGAICCEEQLGFPSSHMPDDRGVDCVGGEVVPDTLWAFDRLEG